MATMAIREILKRVIAGRWEVVEANLAKGIVASATPFGVGGFCDVVTQGSAVGATLALGRNPVGILEACFVRVGNKADSR